MALLGDLVVKIVGDTADFVRQLDHTKKKVDTFDRDLKKIAQTAQKVGMSMTKFITLPIVGLGAAFVKIASDAEETNSMFNAVFKEQAEGVREWANVFAEQTGRGRIATLGFLASIQDLFVPLGASRQAAADFSKQVVTLATDISSFKNIPVADVMRDIESSLVGNYETTRKYGVVLSAATIKTEAYARGLARQGEELTPLIKAQTALQLITESTADAQGDAVRTAGSTANLLVALEAGARDLAESFGQLLLPAVNDLISALRKIMLHFTDMDDRTKKIIITIAGMAAVIGPMLLIFAKAITVFRTLRTATIALNLAMAANPVILLTAGIAALTAGLGFAIAAAIKHRNTTRRNAELMLENNEVTKATTIAIAGMGEVTLDTAEAQLRLTETLIGRQQAEMEYNEFEIQAFKDRIELLEEENDARFKLSRENDPEIARLKAIVAGIEAEVAKREDAVATLDAHRTAIIEERDALEADRISLSGLTTELTTNTEETNDNTLAHIALRNRIYEEQRLRDEANREALAAYLAEKAAEEELARLEAERLAAEEMARRKRKALAIAALRDGEEEIQAQRDNVLESIALRNSIYEDQRTHLEKMREALAVYRDEQLAAEEAAAA